MQSKMVHPLQSPQGSWTASIAMVPGQIKPLSVLFGQISVLHKPRARWCLSKALPVVFKRQNMASRAHWDGRCLQYSSVTGGGWSAKGPLLMLHDSSAFETWAHGILIVARMTEEDQEDHVNQKSNGTCKDAGSGVRKATAQYECIQKQYMLVDL